MNPLSPFYQPPAPDRNFAVFSPDLQAIARIVCSRAKGADPMMVRTHMLSVLSSAIAPLYTISPPHWDPQYISVNSMCIADIGSWKTPMHAALAKPLLAYADDSNPLHDAALAEFEAQREERQLKIELIKAEIKRGSRKGEPIDDLEREFAALNRNNPEPPKHRPRRVINTDLEGLVRLLHGHNEAIDLITDEGEKFLSGSLIRHPAELIDLLDGKSLDYRREKRKHLSARNPCGTLGILCQSVAVKPFVPVFRKNEYIKHKLVELGFFCRLLICVAEPMPSGNGYSAKIGEDELLKKFHDTLRAKYEKHRLRLEGGITMPEKLVFSPEATGYWEEIERVVNHWKFGPKWHIADYVSKMPSLIARVAAVLHVWESDNLFVSRSALERAWEIVSWHADHYELVFAPEPPLPQQEADVVSVIEYLHDNYNWFSCREIQVEPIGLLLSMPNNRLRAALLRVEQRGLLEFVKDKAGKINCQALFANPRHITRR